MKNDTGTIGAMAMPAGFKYKNVYRKGRPRHSQFDEFWRRHIPMSLSRRAKIFAPFDALSGFDEAIAAADVRMRRRFEDPQDLDS